MVRVARLSVVLIVVILIGTTLVATGQEAKFTVKAAKNAPPKDLDESIQKLLPSDSILFLDASGKTVAEFWLRTAIPTDATPEQVKNGVTYREVKQTELFGAVRFEQ